MKPRKFLLSFIIFLSYALWLNVSGSNCEEASNGSETVGPSELETIERSITTPSESSYGETQTVKTLSLSECIEIAMRNYLPLRTAKKSLKLAGWRLWEARRNLLPKVGIKWDEYTGKISGRRFYGRKQSVDIQQTIFHGGEFVFTMKQAETNLKIVNREYARIKNDLILQVKKGYYAFAKAKENFKLQQELSREVSKIHEMIIKEFEAGVTPNLELLNVNSQANQVRFQLVSAKGDVEVAELILKQTMNIDARESLDIDPMPEFRKVEVNFENILADALIHRPEMQISSLMVQYYMYEGKIARSKGWPKIDLMGSFGLAKEEFIAKDQNLDPAAGTVDTDQKLEQQWYAGVKCSIPMWGSTGEYAYTKEHWVPVVSAFHGTETITNSLKFNFLDNLAQYSDRYAADVDIDKAKQEFIKTKQDVTLEAREGCFNYEKALMQLDTALNKVKYQESDLQFIKLKRQMDEIQDSNVIESMIKLAQERFGYVQAISDCNNALAAISKAVGIEDYFEDNNNPSTSLGVILSLPKDKK
jgi:outer membrane protein TolC